MGSPLKSSIKILSPDFTADVEEWYDRAELNDSAVCRATVNNDNAFHEKNFKNKLIHKICKLNGDSSHFDSEVKYSRLASKHDIGPRFFRAYVTSNREYGVIDSELLRTPLKTVLDTMERSRRYVMEGRTPSVNACGRHTCADITFDAADAERIKSIVHTLWAEMKCMHMDMHAENFMYRVNALGKKELMLIDYGLMEARETIGLRECARREAIRLSSLDLVFTLEALRDTQTKYMDFMGSGHRATDVDKETALLASIDDVISFLKG